MPTRCAATLMDVSLLTNYYNQRVLDRAYLAMRAGDAGARVRARAAWVLPSTPEYAAVRAYPRGSVPPGHIGAGTAVAATGSPRY